MATRKNSRTQARRAGSNSGGGIKPAQVFVVGAVVGAVMLFAAPRFLDKSGDGFLRPKPNADAVPSQPLASEQVVADGEAVVAKNTAPKPTEEGTEFDFYNMLPNKEVEMTPAQQEALNRAQQQRIDYAKRQEQKKAEQEAAFASTSPATAQQSSVEVMPDMAEPARALPKPVTIATPAATPKPAPVVKQPEAKPLPKPVVVAAPVAPAAAPAPVATARAISVAAPKPAPAPVKEVIKPVKDRPVVAAASTAAEAPKPKAKAVAAYAKNPDVTVNAKGVAMVMPKAPVAEATVAPAPAKTVVASAAPATSKVLLQAGAYGDQSQAEKVKAKIAMLGLGARVEESTSGGKNVYRVRLGPYAENSDAMDAAKRKLVGGGLSAMEVRVN